MLKSSETKHIRDLAKLADSKEYMSVLTKGDKVGYDNIKERFKIDTNDKLTEAEYHQLTVIAIFLDKFDKLVHMHGIENVDNTLAELARKYRNTLIDSMRDARKKGEQKQSFLEDVRSILVEMRNERGAEIYIEMEKKPTLAQVVREEELKGSAENGE